MDHATNAQSCSPDASDEESIRWRPWPSKGSRGSTTYFSVLRGGPGTSCQGTIAQRNEAIEEQKIWEASQLLDWVQSCKETQWQNHSFLKLAKGSEHLVLYDKEASEVVKITLPDTYGEYYEVENSRVMQFACTPWDYLMRMRLWDQLFALAPKPIGITEDGRIVTRQKFITGTDNPPQETVNEFLYRAKMEPVNMKCWLWKRSGLNPNLEVWVGDARDANFILTDKGIVPIDIRVWTVYTE